MGQQIPDHLEPATKQGLAARLLDARLLPETLALTIPKPNLPKPNQRATQIPAEPLPLVSLSRPGRNGIREVSKSFAAGVGV